MARLARLVVPHVPHHVTQRGNRRQRTFFADEDYRAYLDLLTRWSERAETRIWAYCLMPNHVHVIAVPADETGLTRTFAETHRRYTRLINQREGWRGHLWQSRFASFPMDEAHLFRCVRYVELNPVRARLCRSPFNWPWSSAAEHAGRAANRICKGAPLGAVTRDWAAFLEDGLTVENLARVHAHARSGHPLGSETFLCNLETRCTRPLWPRRPGPKRKG